jgi:hypothetical protein
MKSFLAFVAIVLFLLWGLDKQSEELGKWPEDLESHRARLCDISDYQSCEEWDWFGISSDRLPLLVSENGKHTAISTVLLNEVCDSWRGHDSHTGLVRIIDTGENSILFLCRMKNPKKINRGRVLVEIENIYLTRD